MGKCYQGDVGTIILVDCGCELTDATVHVLMVRKPDGTVVSWDAVVYNKQYLKYVVQDGDFDQVGVFYLQSKVTLGNWSGLGETATFRVYGPYG